MKKLVEEVSGEGLESLLGEYVLIWCMNYNYWGKLIGVNDHDILLTEAHLVYETGELCGTLLDAQKLESDHYIRISAIESYGKKIK